MIFTGMAPDPVEIHDRSSIPSSELIYLASRALREYRATYLITGLGLGWEQALAKAAVELEIPFTVAIPYPGRDSEWDRDERVGYLDLLSRASEVYRLSECYTKSALLESHLWRVDRSGGLFVLWDYEFTGDTFKVMDYALKNKVEVVNLWEDWHHLYSLRRQKLAYPPRRRRGAQVFDSKKGFTSL